MDDSKNAAEIFDKMQTTADLATKTQDALLDMAMSARQISVVMVSLGMPPKVSSERTDEVVAAIKNAARIYAEAAEALRRAGRVLVGSGVSMRVPFDPAER